MEQPKENPMATKLLTSKPLTESCYTPLPWQREHTGPSAMQSGTERELNLRVHSQKEASQVLPEWENETRCRKGKRKLHPVIPASHCNLSAIICQKSRALQLPCKWPTMNQTCFPLRNQTTHWSYAEMKLKLASLLKIRQWFPSRRGEQQYVPNVAAVWKKWSFLIFFLTVETPRGPDGCFLARMPDGIWAQTASGFSMQKTLGKPQPRPTLF